METYVIINLTIECSHNICLFVLLLQAPTGAVHTNFDCPVLPWVSCRYLGVTIWSFVCQDVFFFFCKSVKRCQHNLLSNHSSFITAVVCEPRKGMNEAAL